MPYHLFENPMRILMISRATLFSHPGGDTVQIRKTAEYLNKIKGVEVDVKTVKESKIDYGKYDMLHLFNIHEPADSMGIINQSKLPYVFSTIFVDFSEAEANHPKATRRFLYKILGIDRLQYLKKIARWIKGQDRITDYRYLFKGQKKSIKEIIENAKLLLPNSESEYKRLEKAYGVKQKFKIIPNAIDIGVFSHLKSQVKKYDDFENSIIAVGQITPVKNQLNLVRAMSGTKYKTYIIGSASANAKSYFDLCKKTATDNITFIPYMKQSELAEIYKRAKVHILPSWFETTGLVSLEAAYSGCNIVITRKGDQVEYFGDDAFYCNPENPKSIISAVEKAYNSPFKNTLKEKIGLNYIWEKTAEKTFEGYQETLFEHELSRKKNVSL